MKIKQQLKLWKDGQFEAQATDLEAEAQVCGGPCPFDSEENKFHAYNAQVLSGYLYTACCFVMDRHGNGILCPDNVCTKTRQPILEVLCSKHPKLHNPPVDDLYGSFEPYSTTPTTIAAVVSSNVIEVISPKLSGSCGPSGVDGNDLGSWLLCYGGASAKLRNEMATFTNWIADGSPPWAAIRALMACCLVALDKQPGTDLVGVGEIFCNLVAKSLIYTVRAQATQACSTFNLCAGLLLQFNSLTVASWIDRTNERAIRIDTTTACTSSSARRKRIYITGRGNRIYPAILSFISFKLFIE